MEATSPASSSRLRRRSSPGAEGARRPAAAVSVGRACPEDAQHRGKQSSELTLAEGLPLFASHFGAGNALTGDATCLTPCFHLRDQKPLGYFVLLAALGHDLDSVDVASINLDDPLAQYLALHTSPVLRKHASQWAVQGVPFGDGFLGRMAWRTPSSSAGRPAHQEAAYRETESGTSQGSRLRPKTHQLAVRLDTALRRAGPDRRQGREASSASWRRPSARPRIRRR